MRQQGLYLATAFGAGWLITLMILFNGTLAVHGSLLFSSWVPHATGTVAALLFLAILRPAKANLRPVPLWAYLGGISGALTVMLTSAAMNSALALSGTIAVGLAGQVAFSLLADVRGMFGMPKHMPTPRDLVALALILSGALVLVLLGSAA
ncbi:transporter family-2 protein [Cognatiyoonia koreensis]|uniref:Transporter family-2 protein n=1 Tax=Cognatiyoonia koreensis TaxID=364200 RepID=A0A1I0MLE4_9RHOB|nr:DMT family transporter [Cognatiyoonia koreensis]SEV88697.1 transporter family-2 protein [Cognatiyoonia koreensis]